MSNPYAHGVTKKSSTCHKSAWRQVKQTHMRGALTCYCGFRFDSVHMPHNTLGLVPATSR